MTENDWGPCCGGGTRSKAPETDQLEGLINSKNTTSARAPKAFRNARLL
jgi:hypothetical protein